MKTRILAVILILSIPGAAMSMPISLVKAINSAVLQQTETDKAADKDKKEAEKTGTVSNETSKNGSVASNDEAHRDLARYSVLIGVPLLTFGFAFKAWDWGSSDHWIWRSEGFFGQNTQYGGFDKMGHLWSHYTITRASYNVFNYTEQGRPIKWLYTILIPASVGLAIEVGDAYATSAGFAWEDLVADSTGIFIGCMMERFPVLDAFFNLSMEYSPTNYVKEHPEDSFLFALDYSGWKFLTSFKLAGFEYLGFDIPEFLKYFMIDFGYFTRGYTKFDREMSAPELPSKKRFVYVGVSINMPEVLKAVFNDNKSFASRASRQALSYYHIPFGLNGNHKLAE